MLPFLHYHFLDYTWNSYKIKFNHSKRLSSRKHCAFTILEGKDKEKEKKWGRREGSRNPQNFESFSPHMYTLAHTKRSS